MSIYYGICLSFIVIDSILTMANMTKLSKWKMQSYQFGAFCMGLGMFIEELIK